MESFDNIPEELRALPQWVNWRIGVRSGKKTKIPLNPCTLRKASVDDPETWTSFETAKKNCRNGTGIGFVFTENDPYEGNDFDKCINPETGDIEPWVQKLITEFNSYTEKSQSGTGVHVITKSKLPLGGRKLGRIECYDAGRFFAFTGDSLNVSEGIREVDGVKLHRDLMAEAADLKIVDKAGFAKNGELFKRLWAGDITGYPSQSEADMALAGILYFYTKDRERTDRLFRKCGLYRAKWDEKHFSNGKTYGEAILDKVSQSEEKVYSTETEWQEPIPFDRFSSLPEFPVEALPDIGREFVEAVASVNQVDLGLPASIYLGALSVCAAKKIEVDLRTHKEPVNLYLCPILDSGQRKTSTMSVMTAPIYEYEKTLASNMREAILKSRNRYAINEEKLKKLRRLAATEREVALREQYRREADDVLKEMDENPPLEDPQLIADDITSEKTAELMADNGERLGIFSAEGDLFAIMAGRYNEKGGNFAIYLKAHAGDNDRVNRMGRRARHMSSPALTMNLTVQRDVIDEIGKNRQFKGRGLLARFLYALCKSQVGYRARQEASISDNLLQNYKAHILRVAEVPLFLRTLSLTSEAQSVWNEFYNEIESSMRPGGELDHLCDWSSKLPGAVARIAGLLHFTKHGEDAGSYLIEPLTVASACAIGAYYREHAMAVFGLMREDIRIEAARRILEYIKQHKPKTFKGRDILRNKNFFKTMDDIAPGIRVLIERGYIREQSEKQQKLGRPEAVVYEVNPSIFNI